MSVDTKKILDAVAPEKPAVQTSVVRGKKKGKKVLALKKKIDAARAPAAVIGAAEKGLQSIGVTADDLYAEIKDVRTVVDVATEAWGEENGNSAASCIGVLDLLDYKLAEIERLAQCIMDHTKVSTKARRA